MGFKMSMAKRTNRIKITIIKLPLSSRRGVCLTGGKTRNSKTFLKVLGCIQKLRSRIPAESCLGELKEERSPGDVLGGHEFFHYYAVLRTWVAYFCHVAYYLTFPTNMDRLQLPQLEINTSNQNFGRCSWKMWSRQATQGQAACMCSQERSQIYNKNRRTLEDLQLTFKARSIPSGSSSADDNEAMLIRFQVSEFE